jgi:lipoprotein-anchoring transpeptidase ErfK/SrfK
MRRGLGEGVRWVMAGVCLLAAAAAPGLSSAAEPRRTCKAGEVRWLERWDRSYAGRVMEPTTVYRSPGSGPFLRLGVTESYGFRVTVPIVAQRVDRRCRPTWFRVRVRHYPNGTLGWIKAGTVSTSRIRARIVVDISSRRLSFYKSGRVALTTRIAIGAAGTPTPRGKFFVVQRFVMRNPNGPFGSHLLGISAFSDVLRWWREGGPIGIHGTNDRSSIGQPASHGCVRLSQSAIQELFKHVPLATPVLIRT